MSEQIKYCKACGYANLLEAPSCKLCKSTEFASEPLEKISLHAAKSGVERPIGVTIMAVAQLVVSALEVFLFGTFSTLFSTLDLGGTNALLSSVLGSTTSTTNDMGALLLLFGGLSLVFSLVIAFGLLMGKRWGRSAMIFNGLFDLFLPPVGTVFGIISIVYFMRSNVSDYFNDKN